MNNMLNFIRNDYLTDKRRFVFEAVCTLTYISAAFILAVTTPSPPMLLVYSLWVPTNAAMMYVAYKRGTASLIVLYTAYFVIESMGLFNTIAAYLGN